MLTHFPDPCFHFISAGGPQDDGNAVGLLGEIAVPVLDPGVNEVAGLDLVTGTLVSPALPLLPLFGFALERFRERFIVFIKNLAAGYCEASIRGYLEAGGGEKFELELLLEFSGVVDRYGVTTRDLQGAAVELCHAQGRGKVSEEDPLASPAAHQE